MRRCFAIGAIALACSSSALADPRPPTGEEVFDLLLRSASLPLRKEPLCSVKSAKWGDSITLGQQLATILSVSHQSPNRVSLKSSCEPSKNEQPGKPPSDAWDCKVEMLESSESGEFISSALVAFLVSQDRSTLIAGSLRCL